ncbi:hypothetical protein SG26_06930 [Haloarcula sp. CBA1115]|uniref:hypothetical protein n=1 Tax=unclassified Haloarcula TaxID=2624677 RepID=UPI00059554B8|nr:MULTISPECIES: hypothetical protein [unclassified Haloarcula]AJF25480.1 hypothetical protein SG26_06930 [Haloarcula sp. CBA1115]
MGTTHDETAEAVSQAENGRAMGPAALASVASVALALYFYYVRGDKQRGQFIGLWPATILGLAAYLRLGEIKRLLREGAD